MNDLLNPLRRNEIHAKKIVKEFSEIFPGKCFICSYHRFGYEHGMTNKRKPEPHDCIDKGSRDAQIKEKK